MISLIEGCFLQGSLSNKNSMPAWGSINVVLSIIFIFSLAKKIQEMALSMIFNVKKDALPTWLELRYSTYIMWFQHLERVPCH